MSTYYELLKHPEWQRKRLEIMESAGFMCYQCSDSENMLNVHHGYYERGLKPWEYDDETLHCLCEECHEKAQEAMTLVHRALAVLDPNSLESITGYARALWSIQSGEPVAFESDQIVCGFASLIENWLDRKIDRDDVTRWIKESNHANLTADNFRKFLKTESKTNGNS